MRWLIDYIRSCFCDHTFKALAVNPVFDGGKRPVAVKYSYVCTKCCYIKVHKV